MGSFSDDNHTHAKRKSAIVELVRGKEMAIQLQTLLLQPHVRDDEDGLAASPEDLALQIFQSFTHTLSVLGSGGGNNLKKNKKKKVGIRDRRGCYNRRRTCDSWMTISAATGDGCAWRKYGQKAILNSQYPRCYFRCTHKYDQGCKATKQVQRAKQNPLLYQTTYFNHHTCSTTGPQHTVCSGPLEPNPLSNQPKPDHHDIVSVDHAKSSLDQWLGFVGLECFGYKPDRAPLMGSDQAHSCGSISGLHGLHYEDVNHFGDIDNFQFDEI